MRLKGIRGEEEKGQWRELVEQEDISAGRWKEAAGSREGSRNENRRRGGNIREKGEVRSIKW